MTTPTRRFDLSDLPSNYAESLRLIQDAAPDRPLVVAQLGQSLDGRIALPSGESRWINNGAALDHLHRLRAVVDAVVVGIGTALADDPMLNVRRVHGLNPARVVIDPRGRLKADAQLLVDDGVPRFVINRPGIKSAPGARQIIMEERADTFAPGAIIAALHAQGLSRILIEGGAQTVSTFIDAGAVDRLHLLVAPCLLGSGKTGLNLGPLAALKDARRPRALVHILDGGDVLFDCDMRS
jgi:diaminohydroxyphosphoribosylaminopyrimidine deaminase/5-amino-6-(5-phosphoribosylamino)uracil reductase